MVEVIFNFSDSSFNWNDLNLLARGETGNKWTEQDSSEALNYVRSFTDFPSLNDGSSICIIDIHHMI